MMRRIVVLPLPEAPSSTSASPWATSKWTSWRTSTSPYFLLRPWMLAAGGRCVACSPEAELAASASLALVSSVISCLLDLEPLAREEQDAEDHEGEQRQHDRDRVGGLDLPFVELGEDVQRRRLRAHGHVARDDDRRAELA